MTLLDEIAGARKKRGPRCAVGRLLDEMPPRDAEELRTALADPERYEGSAIRRALTARGVRIGANALQRHRNGECLCLPS